MLADELTEHSLSVTETSPEVQTKLKELLPIAGVNNPIDTTAQINAIPNLLEDFIDITLSSNMYASAVIFLAFTGLDKDRVMDRIRALKKVRENHPDIPLITVTLNNKETKKLFVDNDLVIADDPSRAVKMLYAVTQYRNRLQTESNVRENNMYTSEKHELQSPVLTEYEGKKLISQYNLQVTNERLATSAEQAVKYANELGYPVVMKGMSPQILHKTDVGIVSLNINNDSEVREAYNGIKEKVDSVTGAIFDGVLVQEMLVEDSVEMFIGAKKDPVFGQVILVGMGGIYIEVFQDVSMRKAPITLEEAEKMVYELRGSKLLNGVRGERPYDVKALCKTIVLFSEFISNYETSIEEVDLNPIMVFEEGNGVKIVDALITT